MVVMRSHKEWFLWKNKEICFRIVPVIPSYLELWARLFKTNDAVNVSLKFQTLISQIRQYFFVEKM